MKRKTIILAVVAAAAMAITLVGCGVKITNIAVPERATMEKGESITLSVVYGTDDAPAVTPETAATGESAATDEKAAKAAEKLTIEWTSSDESVATVDETGTVTAVAAGEANVTASVKDADIAASTHIKVVVTPTGVAAPESIDLVTNGENTKDLDAKLVPADATDVKLAYESSDESVATVDETGKVTAVANGECTITTYVTAKTEDAEASELSAVVVEAADSEEVDDSVATMPEDLAAMDSAFGVVPENLKAETKVTVTTNVEGIALDKTEGVLTVGNTVTVTATVTPDTTTNASVTWTSSDEAIATVDSEGKITAVAPGTATITATSDSNPDASAAYAVTVQAKKVVTSTSTKTSSKSNSGNTGRSSNNGAAAAAPSNPAPAPVPDPAPVQPSEPAPAPDPQPEQPSGGDNGGSGDSSNSGDKYGEGYDRWGGPVNSAPTDNGCTQEEIDACDGIIIAADKNVEMARFDGKPVIKVKVPSLATMYVYKPMSGHNLMQAIARVNRVFRDKEGGLVVDYVGIATALKQAMNDYTVRDKKNYGDTDVAKVAYPKFLEKLEVCQNKFHGFDYSKFKTGTDLERAKTISGAVNFIMGREKAEDKDSFVKEALMLHQALSLCSSLVDEDMRFEAAFFDSVRVLVLRLTSTGVGKKISLPEMNSRINELLKQSIKSDGVINLFSDIKEDFNLFDPKFLEEVANMKEKNLAVELLKKLIAEQVSVYRRTNVVKSEKFSEIMQRSLNAYLNGMLTNEEVIDEMLKLAKQIAAAQKEGDQLGLTADELAFYDALTKPQAIKDFYENDELIAITKELADTLRKNKTIDWQKRESARAKMRMLIKKLLKKHKYPPEGMEDAVQTVMTQCELWTDNVMEE